MCDPSAMNNIVLTVYEVGAQEQEAAAEREAMGTSQTVTEVLALPAPSPARGSTRSYAARAGAVAAIAPQVGTAFP